MAIRCLISSWIITMYSCSLLQRVEASSVIMSQPPTRANNIHSTHLYRGVAPGRSINTLTSNEIREVPARPRVREADT
uniref:Putative secreted peptide n=1 Tax=Anopheles braziliensis TaxID=58242 RepID=A0A2M3ZXN1_9DIPT